MIISRTPFRISFFGGGTDYPAWYLKEGGAVLSTTIDKYCFITCRRLPPFFETRHRIVWSRIETVWQAAEIQHPAVREGLRYLKFDDATGVEIHHQGDLPARSGIGSSSAFVVGLVKALTALRGEMISKQALAEKAIELEQSVLKENVGSQDQIATAYGGFNVIHLMAAGDFRVEPMTVPGDRVRELEASLLLVYTGAGRSSSDVAGPLVAGLDQKQDTLRRMRAMVDEAVSIVDSARNLDEFGRLLHESWMLKRSLTPVVTNAQIDDIYALARRHGAVGGKLLGAGAAGFMVFYVRPERRPDVVRALARYLHVPFRFETDGSSIIYYDPNF
jgi:D-glycero-alpha-D-manno-heptose-7-phosphate kinase